LTIQYNTITLIRALSSVTDYDAKLRVGPQMHRKFASKSQKSSPTLFPQVLETCSDYTGIYP